MESQGLSLFYYLIIIYLRVYIILNLTLFLKTPSLIRLNTMFANQACRHSNEQLSRKRTIASQ